jgi:hypothetical protein
MYMIFIVEGPNLFVCFGIKRVNALRSITTMHQSDGDGLLALSATD